jgi:hypothetical protein
MDEYELRIRGRVTPPLLARFEGMHARRRAGGDRAARPGGDQAALHGLLSLIRSLGLELVEVRRLPDRGPAA